MTNSSTDAKHVANKSPKLLDSMFVHVALPVPLRRLFEYRVPVDSAIEVKPGMRVAVPFSRSEKIGIIVKVCDQPQFALNRIKPINKVLDDSPLVNQRIIDLFEWMKNYYHAPPGEVWQTLLPTALLKGKLCQLKRTSIWKITNEGINALENNKIPNNAVKQQQALRILSDNLEMGIPHDNLSSFSLSSSTLKSITGKKWSERVYSSTSASTQNLSADFSINKPVDLQLNDEQAVAVDSVCGELAKFKTWLLFGVTASGKTEVYLQIIEQVIKQGKQALVLVPEIGLTPQTVDRFQRRFNTPIETIHSAMTEQQRLQSWIKARSGEAKIVIGTRSALFVPFKNPGIIIIDEEHDSSFKQQQGLRYSARDIAMVRGNIENIPVLLGSASPSIESLMNVKKGKISELTLAKKAMTGNTLKYRVMELK
ncbi:MAG: primosomal protein N', partial [Kangiellaceae bacterium]|nr:primosomal protein N' [Kangiellaceae bacterium]